MSFIRSIFEKKNIIQGFPAAVCEIRGCCIIKFVPGATSLVDGGEEQSDDGDGLDLRSIGEPAGIRPAAQIFGHQLLEGCPGFVDPGEVLHGQGGMVGADAPASAPDLIGQSGAGAVMVAEEADHLIQGRAEQVRVFGVQESLAFVLGGHPRAGPDDGDLLGFHIVEEGSFGDPRPGTDVVDGDVIEPTLQHEAGGVVFDRLQGLSALHLAQRGLFCTDHISKPSANLHRVQYCTG
ncbi:hypothetical protein [Corynebacterium efficiens YS-314]|uniref:Uncharacterized protein n=1 Tax=Corynebacterium efficiens (strain DSM 44549 / YS-314 / AJ 12310 / JCM 11189 / NBRC 100395) TaxID=196164 RepID=Q8FSJ5_COREF|nr:hypothetical protein [Corynebacterium efficiens YS-314]